MVLSSASSKELMLLDFGQVVGGGVGRESLD